jgi:hypothetical protein
VFRGDVGWINGGSIGDRLSLMRGGLGARMSTGGKALSSSGLDRSLGSQWRAWNSALAVRPRVSPVGKGLAPAACGLGWGVRLRWRGVWGRGWGWRRLDLEALVSTLVRVDRVVVAS